VHLATARRDIYDERRRRTQLHAAAGGIAVDALRRRTVASWLIAQVAGPVACNPADGAYARWIAGVAVLARGAGVSPCGSFSRGRDRATVPSRRAKV